MAELQPLDDIVAAFHRVKLYIVKRFYYIGATKWLRILSIPPNDKIRNHLIANPII